MTTSHPLHESLGVEVIERLSQLQPLPAAGLLAGQSVASCVQEILHGERGPINDIDVFVEGHSTTDDGDGTAIATLDMGVTNEYGLIAVRRSSSEVYRLTGHTRAGLLNTVYYRPWIGSLSDLQLVCGFDLSCVQVGVNLAKRRMVWTPAYERFLKTRQIEIMLLNTPGRTLLRALAKRDALRAYLNVEHCALLCTAHAQAYLEEGVYDDYPLLRLSIGEPQWGIWETYRSELDGLVDCIPFEPKEAKERRSGRWLFVRNDRSDRRLVGCIQDLRGNHATAEGTAVLREHLLRPSRRSEADYASLCRLVDLSSGVEDSETEWAERLGWKALQMLLATRGRLFIGGGCDALDSKARRLARAFQEHPSLVAVGLHGTLDGMDALVRAARSAERRHGRWVWGIAEALKERADLPENLAQAFADDLEADLATMDNLLVDHEPLAWSFAGVLRVRELATRRALREEGAALAHCVGGYGRLVERGASRIFSLSLGRSRSTLELSELSMIGPGWSVAQHCTYRNREPTLVHVCLAAAVESFVKRDSGLSALNAARRVLMERTVWRRKQVALGRLKARMRRWFRLDGTRSAIPDLNDAPEDIVF